MRMYLGKPLAMAFVLITAVGLAGCGSGGGQPGASSAASEAAAPTTGGAAISAEHNAVDVTFAQRMIPHHAQAVAMAELAPSRAGSDQVKRLAVAIQAAQQPEINQMRAMLDRWGAPVPSDSDHGSMSGMDHGSAMHHGSGTDHGSMPGMMTDAEMTQLSQASGVDFDRRFLTMMIAHHQGAVDMSATELAQGSNAQAKALARRITDAQRAEIDQMRQLLAG